MLLTYQVKICARWTAREMAVNTPETDQGAEHKTFPTWQVIHT